MIRLLVFLMLAGLVAGCRRDGSSDQLKQIKAQAEQGDTLSQHNLGVMFANGLEVGRDEAQAVRWFRAAAEKGFPAAQYDLGVMYDSGRGVATNRSEAAAWYRKAGEQGHAFAQYNLAVLHGTGDGVALDAVEAYIWLTLASGKIEIALRDSQKLEKILTPDQLTKARARIDAVRASLPRQCVHGFCRNG